MLQKAITISIFLTVFVSSYIFFKEPFEGYITYIVLVLLFPVFISKYGIPKLPLLIFLPILIVGVINIQIGTDTPALFIKVFIGLFSSVLFYRYVLEFYDFDVKRLFKIYMYGSYLVALIGIFQVLSYQVGFGPGYNFSWFLNKWSVTQGGLGIRMNSIFSEPSNFASVIAPAFFVSIQGLISRKPLFLNRKQLVVIVIAYLLTFSSLGIIGIFITIFLILINLGFFKYAIIFVPLMFFSFDYAYENIPEFTDRYDGTISVFGEQNIKDYGVHGSSFVLYNNYHIAKQNFLKNPAFGTGLGSHELAFDKYSLTNMEGVIQINFNKADANSMLLRLMSETGLYGTLFMLIFLIKCWIHKGKSADDEYWVISNSIALIAILFLARQGHYFLNGFPFFLWLYYFNWKHNKADKEKLRASLLNEDETPTASSENLIA